MSMRQTKHQMIYKSLGLMERLIYRYEEHFKIYGIYPSRIYLQSPEFEQYTECFPASAVTPFRDGHFYFRGAEVLLKK